MKNHLVYLSITILSIISCKQPTTTPKEVNYESKIDSLIHLMTLEEKIAMIHASSSFTSGGVERLGIPELIMSDGPHGVRHEHGRDWVPDSTTADSTTYLPTGITLASTWNRNLGYEYGKVLGSEAKARGKDVILGPGVNILRSPLCGRNFEYLSEDPYLAGEMAVGYIKGVQEQNVSACAKHFVANNQETDRSSVDVKLSERALREIYLPAFKKSVQEGGVYSVMGAYNKINGQFCSHNDYLINKILKDEYGFEGFLVSDWSAIHDTKEALLNGSDIEMGTDLTMLPNPDYNKFFLADSALAMVKRGEVEESYVDEKVRRILRVMFKIHHFDKKKPGKVNTPEHHALALKVAEEGIILLKNDNLLPFDDSKEQTIAVIGNNAVHKHAEEGGSSQVKAQYEITPLDGIKNAAGANTHILYAQGYEVNKNNTLNQKLLDEAVEIAKKADKIVFVGGWVHNIDPTVWGKDAFDTEGIDKKDLKLLFGQETIINEIAKVNPNITVVVMGGSNVEMNNWLPNVKAVLQAWYPGMEGGNALGNILFGKTNPSGKLPMTFANSHLEYPAHKIGEFPGKDLLVEYKEGIYVGYRYFETYKVKPVFPFGYGLSYTTFEFSDLAINKTEDGYSVKCNIKNTGDYDGAEVVQLYIHPEKVSVERPAKELKGFEKVYLKKGETKTVTLQLSLEAFNYYDEASKAWKLDTGDYQIMLGSSVADIHLKENLKIE